MAEGVIIAVMEAVFLPYVPEPGSLCRLQEYYDTRVQMCCSKCPPDQTETQACTPKQNRICTCKPGWYCTLGRQEGCRLCVPLRKCGPGFGVAKPGLIVGVTALGVLILVVVNCVIMTQKKKKPFCLQGDAKVPHLSADKARDAPGPEQQHLLTTAPSSSSSSLESSASATDRRAPTRSQLQAPAEPSSGGHGTQVNVTCIVNVCSSSDHGFQCPSQASSTTGDTDTSPSGSPKDEQVPFSKEECPLQSQLGVPETLLQSPEEKPLPLGVPDAGMKSS
ncbi:tumor necrosis factor receptor superfamily member 1B precursor [Camelus ferus]|nr:tumor necrosis factor receptor superfamily member 1B precursor [Camelus ferus]